MTCILTSSREQNYRIHITNNWFNKLIFMLLLKTLKTFYFTKAPTCSMLVQHFNKRLKCEHIYIRTTWCTKVQ